MGIAPKQAISASLALALAAGLTTFAQSKAGQRALRSVGVVGGPARYTELAFAAPAQLPKALNRGADAVHVAFTITNHEHATVSYNWTVLVSGSPTRVARAGAVPLSQGQQVALHPLIRVRCQQRTRVTVRLSSGEHIGFWVTCTEAARARRTASRGATGHRTVSTPIPGTASQSPRSRPTP